MSSVILLPGNGAHNRSWIESIQKETGGTIQYYNHWLTEGSEIDFSYEAQTLAKNAQGQGISVFAKSAGTLVVMKAVREFGAQIERAVFVGTPVKWGIAKWIPVSAWLSEWNVPTLFIQKEQDHVISSRELSMLIGERHRLLTLPGRDHDYLEFEQYIPQVKEVLERSADDSFFTS